MAYYFCNEGATTTDVSDHVSPILYACARLDLVALKKFIQKGFKLNVRDYYGLNPLHQASKYPIKFPGTSEQDIIYYKQMEMGRFLIQSNIDVNDTDDNGNTPVMLAAHEGNYKLVQFYIEKYGANSLISAHPKFPIYFDTRRGIR